MGSAVPAWRSDDRPVGRPGPARPTPSAPGGGGDSRDKMVTQTRYT